MTRFITPNVVLACLLAIAWSTAAEPKGRRPSLDVLRNADGRPFAVIAVGPSTSELGKLHRDKELSSRVLAVYVVNDVPDLDVPPIVGTYEASQHCLEYTPRFPFVAGTKYRAVFNPAALSRRDAAPGATAKEADKPITLEFAVPAEEPGEPTEVVQVYPSSSTLPENNLRFYIHFSESMGRGEAYRHLLLLDAKDQPIDEAFLEIGEELWDPRARRMTLLIDPGRIKKGVKPREELGPVLEAGHEYKLVIGRGWHDATGRPLKAEYLKRFRAGPPAEAAINPESWKIMPPNPGSPDPLVIRFPAPLDRALLERTISVAGLEGPVVAGRVTVADEERRWEFRPHAVWKAGRYQLVIDTALEDLAGNRIGKPFEVDEFSEVQKSAETEPTRLPFEIR